MNNKTDNYIICAATILTVLSNLLMLFVFKGDYSFQNILVICFALFAQYNVYIINKRKVSIRKYYPERWGIFGLSGVSIIWLSNRISTINVPVQLNIVTLGIAGLVTIFLFIVMAKRLLGK